MSAYCKEPEIKKRLQNDRIDIEDLFDDDLAILMKADYEFQRAFEEFEKADDLKGMYVSMEYKVRVRKENEDLH